jgi:hypothetical protein
MRWCYPLILGFILAAASYLRGAEPTEVRPTPAQLAHFESKVRPLLAEKCYSCHSAEAREKKNLKAGLRVDSLAGMIAGGETGPSLVPGKPEESLIIKAVRYTDSDLKMPPKTRLSDAEIRLLEDWVKQGAPGPREDAAPAPTTGVTIDIEKGRGHWSFQPVRDGAPPAVRDGGWTAGDLDRFILAPREAAGIASPKPADRITLIRRATFDLTGLPPTAGEIEAFLGDESPGEKAFAKVVDRLLASPRYGERWGRHWLDVARYADSNGLDENVAHGNAWRYRDYVIASFNEDKPFDRFIVEQVAGDLISRQESPGTPLPGSLIATGFLTLGPKVLAEVDKTKMEMDIIDEQLDTTGRAFLGLTIGCARCHDHKFDPITAKDYYGLAGIFKSTKTMESFATIAKWWENPIPTPEDLKNKSDHDAKVGVMKAAVAARVEKANADLLARMKVAVKAKEGEKAGESEAQASAVKLPEKPEAQYDDGAKADLKKLRDELTALEKNVPLMSAAMGVTEGKPTNLAIHIRGSHLTLGAVAPRQFPQVFGDSQKPIGDDRSGRLELAHWIASRSNPLTARVIVNRVWRWHFGRGLVRTPDNFGKLGESPTHPQLLDWLAARFVEEGWSIKALHRRIMLSSTYRMSSGHEDDAVRLDPENRLYSRAPVRRLEAEAIRDAMLFVSDRLDGTMGGPAITHVKNREFLFDHTSKDGTRYDTTRRSVYLPVIRNHLYDFFELFDFPDSAVPQGDRPTTTVAPQALLAMNSPLVWDCAAKLAEGFEKGGGLRDLYMKALGRPPEPRDTARFEMFMKHSTTRDAKAAALRMYCQALLAANEFVYVR